MREKERVCERDIVDWVHENEYITQSHEPSLTNSLSRVIYETVRDLHVREAAFCNERENEREFVREGS